MRQQEKVASLSAQIEGFDRIKYICDSKQQEVAREDVLATRKLIKVCQSQSYSEGASSPFAAINLVNLAAASQLDEVSKDTNKFSNQAEISLEKEVIEVGKFALKEVDEKEIVLNSTDLNSGKPTSGKKKLQGESSNFTHTILDTEETDIGYSKKEKTEKAHKKKEE